jgi:hypothetical protein
MRLTRWVVVLALSTTTFTALAPAAQAAEIDLHARLTGSTAFSRATGSSEYDRNTTERDVEVTVRNIAGLAGKSVTVWVSGSKVGTIRVTTAGVAHREWDTERGQFVPIASAGDFVKVRTAGGALIASAKYVRSGD